MHQNSAPDGYLHGKIDRILEILDDHSEILATLQSSAPRNSSVLLTLVEILMSPRVSKWIGSGLLTGAGYLLSRLTQ